MKRILRSTLLVVLLMAALVACGKNHEGGGGLRSQGDISVNGTGFDGTMHVTTKLLYTLRDIHEGQYYTMRTEIALLTDRQTPDGTLTVDIYESADAFTNNPAVKVTSAVAAKSPNANVYETYFPAPSSGDYVVILSGESLSVKDVQFFYNLRLMSADPNVTPAVLKSFTSTTIPAFDTQVANPLSPGFLNIYNGGDVTSSGTFTISLVSNATITLANPQIFVYKDSRLTIDSLIVSSISTSANFVITRFHDGIPDISNIEQHDANVISGVTFTSRTDTTDPVGGPFILLKGLVTLATYTLSVEP